MLGPIKLSAALTAAAPAHFILPSLPPHHSRLSTRHPTLQVVRSAQNYTEAARDEVMLLQQIRDNDPEDASHCVRLLDQFEHCGPHGRHVCEVFEPMGDDLLTLIRWVLVLSDWVLVLCWW